MLRQPIGAGAAARGLDVARAWVLALTIALAACLPDSARAEKVTGAGSTFAFPILSKWGQAFGAEQAEGGSYMPVDGGLDYEPVGSLAGTMRVIQGAVDFGATDVPLSPAELDRHGLAQFPFVTGGVAVVANLPGIPSGSLQLSGEVLAGIFLGTVGRWSDAAITALNPGLSLPDAAIRIVRREDGSGTTYNFADYLADASPEWRRRVGVDTLLKWPAGLGAKGNDKLAELVKATEGAIGYVELSQAVRLGLSTARIENKAGRFVAPSTGSVQAAAASAAWDPKRHFNERLVNAPSPDAYPIAATVFALVPRNAGTAQARRTLAFFRLGLGERSVDATALGYAPLPASVSLQIAEYWRATIRGAR